jgi:peptidoglycan/LPS O-acetylase OafA/YrhL
MTDNERDRPRSDAAAEHDRVEERVRGRAIEASERTERLLDAATGRPRPPLAPIGVTLLGLVAVWITVAITWLYPSETVTPTRLDGMVATALALAAIRVWSARGAARATATVALGLGLLLLLLGLLASDTGVVAGVRVVSAVVACLGATLCLASPSRRPGGPGHDVGR